MQSVLASKKKSESSHQAFITFGFGGMEYGINALSVHEVIAYKDAKISPAHAVPFIKGMMYVGEKVIPIMDLGVLFDRTALAAKDCRVIIIIKGLSQMAGLMVSQVPDIIDLDLGLIAHEEINYVEIIRLLDEKWVEGVVSLGNRKIIILNIENLLSGHQIELKNDVSNS